MPTRARFLIATIAVLATVFTLALDVTGETDEVSAVRPAPSPELAPFGTYGADEDTLGEIEAALTLFDEAGLELPELRIFVHYSYGPCNGNQGLYSKGADQHRIDICTRSRDLIVHELAHAWEFFNVDDETRQQFMTAAEVETWNDHSVAHSARGVEQAAHVVKWGITGGEISPMSVGHYAPELAQFELLTGNSSPRLVEATSSTLRTLPAAGTTSSNPV